MPGMESDDAPDAAPQRSRPRRIGLTIVALLVGALAVYKIGGWVKTAWIDPDRMLVGVHPIDDEDAIVMYRYDGGGALQWHIARLSLAADALRWRATVEYPLTASMGNGMSVAGGYAVVLVDTNSPKAKVTAYDVETGEPAWSRELPQADGYAADIAGADPYVIIDANDFVYVLDRERGATIYEQEGSQHANFAFTEEWIQLDQLMTTKYLDPASGRSVDVKGIDGELCRVEDVVYGFERDVGLVAHDLSADARVTVLEAATPIDDQTAAKMVPWSCGWLRVEDALRLVFTSRSEVGALGFAVDVEGSDARVAWTLRHEDAEAEVGTISYTVQNRLDLLWFGELPRFAPLELQLRDSPRDTSTQIVTVDVLEGRVAREGTAGDWPFVAFKRDGAVIIRSSEWFAGDRAQGWVFTLDGATGELLGALQQDALWVGPHSIVGDTIWAWKSTSFSRERDMAIITADRALTVKATRDPDRVPANDPSVATALLGRPRAANK